MPIRLLGVDAAPTIPTALNCIISFIDGKPAGTAGRPGIDPGCVFATAGRLSMASAPRRSKSLNTRHVSELIEENDSQIMKRWKAGARFANLQQARCGDDEGVSQDLRRTPILQATCMADQQTTAEFQKPTPVAPEPERVEGATFTEFHTGPVGHIHTKTAFNLWQLLLRHSNCDTVKPAPGWKTRRRIHVSNFKKTAPAQTDHDPAGGSRERW